MMNRVWFRVVLLAGTVFAALGVSGCGAGITTLTGSGNTTTSTVAVAAAHGIVMGGQQPVGGVTLQLYQAGTSGYGSAAIPLGPSAQTTAGGNFNLPSYTCSAGSQVYLAGTGGQPIAATMSSPAVTNNNLALMVGLGTCGGTYLNNFINVNELTTVATVWALSPFMTGIANIGTSSTNTAGLADAFAAINEIVNTANGTLPGPTLPTGATLPVDEIYTLGDILAQCVNSGGGVAGDSSNCGNLFQLAPNAGTGYPTDTITAAMNIAQNPGRNFVALNVLHAGSGVFQPTLNVNMAASSWTVAITYTGGGLNTPTSIAADAMGAVWVSNSGSGSGVTKLDSTGTAVSGAGGFFPADFNAASAIAIDTGGNAWIANSGNNTVTELNPTGSSATVYAGNGLNSPGSIAIDGSGNIWVANTGSTGTNSVSAFTGSGSALTGSPYSGAGTSTPGSIAVTPK